MRFAASVMMVMMATGTAASKPLTIQVSGDACDLNALDAELATMLMLADKPVEESHVTVVTRAAEQSLTAEVLFRDHLGRSRGPRIVTAATCSELFDAITLVIAMAIPTAEPADQDADAHAPAVPEARPAPTVVAPAAAQLAIVSTVRPRHATHQVALAAYLAGASGVTGAGSNEQLLLGVRARRDAGSLTLQLRGDAPQEIRVNASGQIVVKRAELSFAPCAHVSSLAGCALATVGVLHGAGVGLQSPRDAVTPVLATGLRVTWERNIGDRLAFRVHVDGQALLTRTTFEVDYMPVWTSSRIEGSAGVGLLARFL